MRLLASGKSDQRSEGFRASRLSSGQGTELAAPASARVIDSVHDSPSVYSGHIKSNESSPHRGRLQLQMVE